MKRKIALILAALMLLSGCENTAATETTTTTAETTTTASAPATTTTASATETTTTTAATTSENLSLMELSPHFYPVNDIVVKDRDNREMFSVTTLLSSYFIPVSDKTIEVDSHEQYIQVRGSSTALARKGEITAEEMLKNEKYTNFSDFKTVYQIEWENPVITFSEVTSSKMTMESAVFSYHVKDNFKVNAFIRSKGETAEIIIDPAYMYNLPVLTSAPEEMTFDINGTEIIADTLSVNCSYGDNTAKAESQDLVYAELTLSSFSCNYSTTEGYANNAVIESLEILSEDTESVIDTPSLVFDEDKDPEMTEIYNAVVKNLDTILTDETYGIELVDMDFDGKPEVLVTRVAPEEQESLGYYSKVDVDIYRVKDEELKYIDTLFNLHTITDMNSNIIGLKTLENGEKGWFGTSYKNRDGIYTGEESTDYFYTLNGDTLEYKELYHAEVISEEETEYGWINYEYDYYIMGEKVIPEVTYDYEPYDVEQTGEKNWPYYSWRNYTATFGLFEIVGFARADFCEDIELTYTLYSDWLTTVKENYYNLKRVDVSKRTAAYKIAYAVDEYYLGEYNNAEQDYNYWFLGAYAKPVIYLYPEEETDVSVQVEFAGGGELTCTYPEYNDGWNVTAMPDGTLYDKDGNEYYCLYWEGDGNAAFDMSEGFCVKGSDTASFLREKLLYMGLTPREANEFIIYWLPIMEKNPYNVITFHTDDYAESVPMTVSPAPDTVIRVFMTFAPSEEYVAVSQQSLPRYERSGFTVVEWGGGECELLK